MQHASNLTRRDFLKVMVFAAGSLVEGCGPSRRHDGRTRLTQWYHQYGESGTQDAVIRYAREYTRLNPHVEIRVVWVPGDYGSKLATAMLVPGGPDVFEYNGPIAAMVGAGQVAPLDDLFTPEILADFSPKDMAANSFGGKVYGIECHQGDLIRVPAGTPHWFDMGPAPHFRAIRLFTNPAGWVANYTGSTIAASFPRMDAL